MNIAADTKERRSNSGRNLTDHVGCSDSASMASSIGEFIENAINTSDIYHMSTNKSV